MQITLMDYTRNAKEMLIFSKDTRHLSNPSNFDEIMSMSSEQKDREIGYVLDTIQTPLRFVNYTFLLTSVSRGFTHQLVRHGVGTGFAQQSMRVADSSNFSYVVPDKIEEDGYLLAIYNTTMGSINDGYQLLVKKGADNQDARGVLPTNVCTNILMVINLQAFTNMIESRLCVRAQGEFQEAALTMRELVLSIHPFLGGILRPPCVKRAYCMFPRFTECPLRKKYKHLTLNDELNNQVGDDLEKLLEHRYSPQPIVHPKMEGFFGE